MNVYTCEFGGNHVGGCLVVVAESHEEAIKVAQEELVKKGYMDKSIEAVRVIPLDVKRAYILNEFGY